MKERLLEARAGYVISYEHVHFTSQPVETLTEGGQPQTLVGALLTILRLFNDGAAAGTASSSGDATLVPTASGEVGLPTPSVDDGRDGDPGTPGTIPNDGAPGNRTFHPPRYHTVPKLRKIGGP